MTSSEVDLLIENASEVLTCAPEAPDLIGRIPRGELAITDGKIVAVGQSLDVQATQVLDAGGGVVMPGFVDPHTHVVFGGDRVDEFASALEGRPAPEGSAVGILGTVRLTQSQSLDDLASVSQRRVSTMVDYGTTTVESKSGYGLNRETELCQLMVNQILGGSEDIEVVSTYLGAHAFPDDASPESYVAEVIDTIPEVVERGLAEFCDVYCDDGYFNLDQTRRILEAGRNHGLAPKIHLDAYSHTGAATLAVELGATSVDHLNMTSQKDLELLAAAGIVGVYMPCLDFAVAHPAPLDVRAAMDTGLEIALSTDFCPGCWTPSMPFTIAMACHRGGMSVAQAVRAATHGAAKAIGRADRVGSLAPGMQADVLILDTDRHENIAYQLGTNPTRMVLKRGRLVRTS